MNNETIELNFFKPLNKTPPKIKHKRGYYGKIDEYTLDGIYIRTWLSSKEIGEHFNISHTTILRCCHEKILIVEKIGRIFLFENDDIKLRLHKIEKQNKNTFLGQNKAYKLAIDEYDIQGNLVRLWDSISEIGYRKKVINCCLGKTLHTKNNEIYLFHGDDINLRLKLIEEKKYQDAMSKSIDEYSTDGKLIKHWKQIENIRLEYNIPSHKIIDSCFGNINSINKRIFLFSGDSINKRLKIIKSKKKTT